MRIKFEIEGVSDEDAFILTGKAEGGSITVEVSNLSFSFYKLLEIAQEKGYSLTVLNFLEDNL